MKALPLHIFGLSVSVLFGCQQPKSESPVPKISFVTVEPDVRLEIVDWGGSGENLLFLGGLGNSAHIFDGFAPQYTDEYHVWGLSRRGFGASDKPGHGYHLDTLTKDILTVMDSLKIRRVTLIGFSIAGEEVSKFATLYPERVDKLVYLDAAFDRTDLSFGANAPEDPEPVEMTAADSSSPESVQQFFKKLYGVDFGLSEIKATSRFDKKGRYLGDGTPNSILAAMMTIFESPAYEKIKAPALAFYSLNDSVKALFPYYDVLDSLKKKDADSVFRLDSAHTQQQMERFRTGMAQGQVIGIHGAKHHLFLSDSAEVSREIRKFLSGK